jgi:hypothetical protein
MLKNLTAYAFADERGRNFEVVAANFGDALWFALSALSRVSDGRSRLPRYQGVNRSLPGVGAHVLARPKAING